MSCRVLSRGVEQFIMNHVFDIAKELNIESVLGLYSPTSKNAMVKDFFLKFGFVEKNVFENKDVEYIISTKDYIKKLVYLNEED
jgi:predicted enzyme involved in methoxymalonyl-ACP biosynthesis